MFSLHIVYFRRRRFGNGAEIFLLLFFLFRIRRGQGWESWDIYKINPITLNCYSTVLGGLYVITQYLCIIINMGETQRVNQFLLNI